MDWQGRVFGEDVLFCSRKKYLSIGNAGTRFLGRVACKELLILTAGFNHCAKSSLAVACLFSRSSLVHIRNIWAGPESVILAPGQLLLACGSSGLPRLNHSLGIELKYV